MELILATPDPVTMNYAGALLRDAGLHFQVLDTHMSVMEGSIGIFPRRLLVPQEEAVQARRVLKEAGLGHELRPSKG